MPYHTLEDGGSKITTSRRFIHEVGGVCAYGGADDGLD
jgi:hypothetical protein